MIKQFKNDIKGYFSNEFILLLGSIIAFVIVINVPFNFAEWQNIFVVVIFTFILLFCFVYNILFLIRFTKVPIMIQNKLITVYSLTRKYQFYYSEVKKTDYKFAGKMRCNYGTVIIFLKNGKKIRIQRVADLFEVRKYF